MVGMSEQTAMSPLEFLEAAHARAEAAARAATPGPWEAHPPTDTGDGWEIRAIVTPGREWRWVVGAESGGGVYEAADARHVALHDPAATLRRIAAERRLLEAHQQVEGNGYEPDDPGERYGPIASACSSCGTSDEYAVPWPCPTVRALAEAWGWTDDATPPSTP